MPRVIRMGAISFLTLYLELALIRFLPAHILYLGYFSNIILLAAFLGIGIGFLLSPLKRNLLPYVPVLLVILVAFTRFSGASINIQNRDVVFLADEFYPALSPLPLWVLVPVIFVVTGLIFACLTQLLGRLFTRQNKPLIGYIADIAGSITGLIFFSVLSIAGSPPAVWFALWSAGFILLLPHSKGVRIISGISAAAIILMALDHGPGLIVWSPYYKLTLLENTLHNSGYLYANNIGHQSYTNLKDSAAYPLLFFQTVSDRPLDRVLIIGSGMGQDVASALLAGAKHIDAVDIDPGIVDIGRRYNPLRPYSDPHVNVHIDDGRHFLRTTTSRYDLIVFALTDSLVLSSSMGQVRLESYLFTDEAFMEAKNHLTPAGQFMLYNDYRELWLIDRIGDMLTRVFGHPPRIMRLSATSRMFLASTSALTSPSARIIEPFIPSQLPPKSATDNWPFLYLRTPSIPLYYSRVLAGILLLSVGSLILILHFVLSKKRRKTKRMVFFFLLGLSFSLLETKSITQLALLFGSTWAVNSLAFGSILLSVLVATIIVYSVPTVSKWRNLAAVLLFLSLTVQYTVSASAFLHMDLPYRLVLSLIYFFLPITLANILFADFFAKSRIPALEMGMNIMGLVVGGIVEYTALITGYSFLTVIVMVSYALALLVASTNNFSQKL